jgi:cathepsin A (carboxypeptidase C)
MRQSKLENTTETEKKLLKRPSSRPENSKLQNSEFPKFSLKPNNNTKTIRAKMISVQNLFAFLALLPLFASADYTPEALADEVKNLPGAEALDFSFRQFSGYLDVTATKHLHYWFVESSGNPSKDPVAFWTNGGPGCSGLLGFLSEQGPFRPNKDLSLSYNPYSWNTLANMVFIEAPCGVGFSYSSDGTGDDYHTGDAQTAADNYQLIQQFFNRFPQFRANDLYITSESYGGHYMPTLAKEIVDRNATGEDAPLNFRGFAVGNPQTHFYSAIPASLDTYWGHQIISKPLWDTFLSTCRNETHRPNVRINSLLLRKLTFFLIYFFLFSS